MTHFRVNAPNVIHETIDGEAVIVNLQSGSYYSIDKVGAAVWSHLESGLSVPRIVDAISAEYSGDRAVIDRGIRALFTQLEQEGLVVAATATAADDSAAAANGAAADGHDRPRFEPPVLHKYTDMEDLLLLDPIHDVGDKGWPNAPDKK
jgi:hypothetical protein